MSSSPALFEEVVVVWLGRKAFAFSVGSVREVVQMVDATPMPSWPASVLGIIDVRGEMLPLVDVSTALSQVPTSVSKNQFIVILFAKGRNWGVLVDSVEGVRTLELRLTRPDRHSAVNRGLVADQALTAVLLNPDGLLEVLGIATDLLGDAVSVS